MKHIKKNQFLMIILLVTTLNLVSCARSVRLINIPIDNRIKCLVLPLKDITGSYDPVEPKLESLMEDDSKTNFVEYEYRGTTSSYDRTIYLTNHFIIYKDNNRSKESIINEILDSSHDGSTFDLLITGTVEQLKYGSPNEISKYIIDAWLWGVWGLIAREKSEKLNRAALLEYNFKIFDLKTKKQVASFTVQGAEKLPINDREKIVMLANKKVAQGVLFRLNKEVSKLYNIEPKRYYRIGKNYYEWK